MSVGAFAHPTPHGAVIHDIYDDADEMPRCCAKGCQCGARPEQGPMTREEYAALQRGRVS